MKPKQRENIGYGLRPHLLELVEGYVDDRGKNQMVIFIVEFFLFVNF